MSGVETARSPVRMRVGRYEMLFRIAAGGMAEVYAARLVGEGGFEKLVAVKRMLPELANDERFVAMFLDEGRVAANVSSPYVVQTLDLGRADDQSLYLVMELVLGVSLSSMMGDLARRRMPPPPLPIAAEMLAQAAQGLHDAHEAKTTFGKPLGIVHRDISPQNIMVDVNGRARITDFGVARALQRLTRTASGEVKGKLAYFAPEQARGEVVDRRTDVFAFGVVVWEILAGRRLFSGPSPADIVRKVLTLPIPRLDEVRPEVPRALADAVARALERKLPDRTATVGELAQAIRASTACAGASAVGAFVRDHGGEALAKLESSLHGSEEARVEQTAPATASDERSGVVPSGTTPVSGDPESVTRSVALPAPSDEATTRPRRAERVVPPEPDALPGGAESPRTESVTLTPLVDAEPSPPVVPPRAAPVASAGPSSLRRWAVVALFGVVLLVGAVIAWLARDVPVPAGTTATPSLPVLAPPRPSASAAPTTPPPSVASPSVASPSVVSPPSVASPPSTTAAAREPREARRRVPTPAAPAVTPPAPASAAPPGDPASERAHPRRGTLHGLDDFDRE